MLEALEVAAVAKQAAVQRVAAVPLLVVQLHLAVLQQQTQVVAVTDHTGSPSTDTSGLMGLMDALH